MGLSILLAFTQQYWQILGIQFFWGFFSALMFTPSMSIFVRWFSPHRHTTASTLPTVGMSLGILAINILFPMIVNHFDTWRTPFIMFGIAGIIFALGLLFLGRDAGSKTTQAKFRLNIIWDIFRYKQVLDLLRPAIYTLRHIPGYYVLVTDPVD